MTMLFVDTVDEAAAASAAGIDILSIIDPLWTPAMRAAAGNCRSSRAPLWRTVHVGRLFAAAHAAILKGGDAVFCAASLDTIAKLSAEGIPVIGHVGLIPSKATRV
jgi:3-methyl-2-oxobutanoate hydroxymethyltransferase